MSSTIDHIQLANKNHKALLYLLNKPDDFPEWIATIAFYKAVHVVEGVFASDGKHSNGHDSRLSELKQEKYRDIFKAYRPLYAASLVARYLADSSHIKFNNGPAKSYKCSEDFIPASQVPKRLVFKRLKTIEDSSVRFFSEDQKKQLLRVDQKIF